MVILGTNSRASVGRYVWVGLWLLVWARLQAAPARLGDGLGRASGEAGQLWVWITLGFGLQGCPEVGPKSIQNRPKVSPEAGESRPKVGPEAAQSQPRVGPELAHCRPRDPP